MAWISGWLIAPCWANLVDGYDHPCFLFEHCSKLRKRGTLVREGKWGEGRVWVRLAQHISKGWSVTWSATAAKSA